MSVIGRAESTGRQAANSRAMETAARIGFIARGVMYLLIGLIAEQIALGHGGRADRGGALTEIAGMSYGSPLLWMLVVGFAGLALWRASEAAFGAAEPGGHQAGTRLKSAARAVMYACFFVSTLRLVLGSSSAATADGNGQSKSVTAQVMAHAGGRWLVGLAGGAVVLVGLMLVKEAWTKEFLRRMNLSGASTGTRKAVEKLGLVGGAARGIVVALAGVFLVTAAVQFSPNKAEGIDGTLRTFAHTPLGPWLLMLVAAGLIAFGLFSWTEARWRRV